MGKPLGVQMLIGRSGPTMKVTPIDRVADLIWDAVEEAEISGWTAKQFVAECRDAWEECAQRKIKEDLKEFD